MFMLPTPAPDPSDAAAFSSSFRLPAMEPRQNSLVA
jgi:hypothetical protein